MARIVYSVVRTDADVNESGVDVEVTLAVFGEDIDAVAFKQEYEKKAINYPQLRVVPIPVFGSLAEQTDWASGAIVRQALSKLSLEEKVALGLAQ